MLAENASGDLPTLPGVRFRRHPQNPAYVVGDDGSVWSNMVRRGFFSGEWRRISQYRRPYGSRYTVVCLRADDGRGKVICCYVHRLVLEAFVGMCPDGMVCRHLDGNTANNRLGNLAWGTPTENAADRDTHGTTLHGELNPSAKLTNAAALEVRQLAAGGMLQREIAARFGVTQSAVSAVVNRKNFKHLRAVDAGVFSGEHG